MTLKEAVESGRRWRYIGNPAGPSPWYDHDTTFTDLGVKACISSDFEIEPEPQKPREWFIHLSGTGNEGHVHAEGCCSYPKSMSTRVHDADSCDRLKAGGHGGACR